MLETQRLTLRPLGDSDAAAFAALNASPEVMRYFPAPLSAVASDASLRRLQAHQHEHGFSLWAVHLRNDGRFLGVAGLLRVTFAAPFCPAVEVGWRFMPFAWGQGYATEAAVACCAWAFRQGVARELVSFTSTVNLPSQAVMQRVGFVRDAAGDFLHPRLDPNHVLAPHLLYRLKLDDFTE